MSISRRRLVTTAASLTVALLALTSVVAAADAQEAEEESTSEPTATITVQIEPLEVTTYRQIRHPRTVVVGRESVEPGETVPDEAEEAERSLEELGAQRTPEGLVVTLPETVLFAFDSAELTGAADATISEVAEILGYYADVEVEVAGHTDSQGAADYNQTLSEQRAQAVVDALVAAGASSSQLTAVGYGASRPVAPNETADGQDDPAGREQNRRVEIILRES